jgi:hypothetical protein
MKTKIIIKFIALEFMGQTIYQKCLRDSVGSRFSSKLAAIKRDCPAKTKVGLKYCSTN